MGNMIKLKDNEYYSMIFCKCGSRLATDGKDTWCTTFYCLNFSTRYKKQMLEWIKKYNITPNKYVSMFEHKKNNGLNWVYEATKSYNN